MRPPAAPAATLDLQSLSDLRATLGSEESFHGLLNEFMSSSASLADQLRAGLAGAPPRSVALAAHTLKSMAWLIGATGLGETCRRVEALANATPPTVTPDVLRTALAQLDETRDAIRSMLR